MNAPADYDIAQLKLPPHSLEAEQSVIGGLMIANNAWDGVAEIISENDFYRPEHRLIFRCMAQLVGTEQPIDIVTLHAALESAGEIERAGGFVYLAEIARNTPSAANVRAYARAVRERANLRSLIRIGSEIADSAYNSGGRSSGEILDEAQRAVLALGEQSTDEVDLHVSAALRDYASELDRRSACAGLVGLGIGFAALDSRTNGLSPGDLVVLAGRPGSGKTTLAMNIAEHVSIVEGKGVLVFSMEMSRSQLLDRMIASVGDIPYSLLRSGRVFSTEYRDRVGSAAGRIKNSKLYIDDRGALSIAQMRASARRLHKKNPLALIVVDYLQLARAKAENRVNEITAISQGLKALAKELGVPLIALSQLSRKCEEQRRRPTSSDLRDSGSIEQDADSIFLIYRDELYNDNSPDKGKAEIHCTKLRNGEPGLDWVESDLARCRFKNLTAPYQSQATESKRAERFSYA